MYIRAYCDNYDTYIGVIGNSIMQGSSTHWHPDEDDMFDELYSIGKNGNILVIHKTLIGVGVFYIGEPDKYRFSPKKKWYRGKLIYVNQK